MFARDCRIESSSDVVQNRRNSKETFNMSPKFASHVNSISSTIWSPNELNADDGRLEDVVVPGMDDFLSVSLHSLILLTSDPSTLIARGSEGFPSMVPTYLDSSSVAVLCFFFKASSRVRR